MKIAGLGLALTLVLGVLWNFFGSPSYSLDQTNLNRKASPNASPPQECQVKYDGCSEKEKGHHAHDKKAEGAKDHKEGDHHDEGHADEDHHGKEEAEHQEHDKHTEQGEGKGHGGHDDQDEHEESGFGEGKAILAVKNEGEMFQLSSESEKFLDVQTGNIQFLSSNTIRITRENLVEFKDQLGIFIKSKGWFKLVEVAIVSENKSDLVIKPKKSVGIEDLLVIRPLGTLRAAHLQASGEGGKGHAH